MVYGLAVAHKRDEWWALGFAVVIFCVFLYGGIFVRNATQAGMFEEEDQ